MPSYATVEYVRVLLQIKVSFRYISSWLHSASFVDTIASEWLAIISFELLGKSALKKECIDIIIYHYYKAAKNGNNKSNYVIKIIHGVR